MNFPNESFKIEFNENWFKKDQIINTGVSEYIIISKPTKKWYLRIFQFFSFGFYKVPWTYVIRLNK